VANLEHARLVERHTAEWFRLHAIVPGAEVHVDPDITWVVSHGSAWANAGTLVRFTAESAGRRLDALVARYAAHGRGMGLWIAPDATPPDLPRLLRARRLHCRKHFPAMLRRLDRDPPKQSGPPDIECRPVDDVTVFERIAHPSIGPITTPIRRARLDSLRALVTARPVRTWAYVAWLAGEPVGASMLFLGDETAGLHDLTVLESHRGRGIGSALLEHTCREARRHGAGRMVLLATSDGQRVYDRTGFEEVARFGFWYRSFQRR
jgi:GNAT superfamily N-acetyltransferase